MICTEVVFGSLGRVGVLHMGVRFDKVEELLEFLPAHPKVSRFARIWRTLARLAGAADNGMPTAGGDLVRGVPEGLVVDERRVC